MIGVALVDGEETVRAGLRATLTAESDIDVLGEAGDGVDVPDLVRRLRPDVLLLDVRMPLVDGIDATRLVAGSVGTCDAGPTRVLVLTTFGNDGHVYDALLAGASGFLLKRARPAEVVAAVRTVACGEALLFPAAVRDLVATQGRRAGAGGRGGCARAAAALTDREAGVLRAMARGLSDVEIARYLTMPVELVAVDVAAALAKLDARGRTQAVVTAYESGVIDPTQPTD